MDCTRGVGIRVEHAVSELYVQKIIDTLHMKNHSDPRCDHEQYNPAKVLPEDSGMNTMSCEQTFAWLSRYIDIDRARDRC